VIATYREREPATRAEDRSPPRKRWVSDRHPMPSEPRKGRKNSTVAFAPLGLNRLTTHSRPWLTPWATILRPLRGLGSSAFSFVTCHSPLSTASHGST
jgi:hypothetical protein